MFELLRLKMQNELDKQIRNAKYRKETLKCFIPIFIKYRVKYAYLFGSVLRGKCKESSDIDLYVEKICDKDFWKFLRELKKISPYDIDIYTQSDDKNFIMKIKQRGIKIYEAQH